MAVIWTSVKKYRQGDKVYVSFAGWPPNETAKIAWFYGKREGVRLILVGPINKCYGTFNTGPSGDGTVVLTTSQCGKELSPGYYYIYAWDDLGNSAYTGPIEIVSSLAPTQLSPDMLMPVAGAAGGGIGLYLATKDAKMALAGAVIGAAISYFIGKRIK